MRIIIISKRKMKKALSRNVYRHGISSHLLLRMAGQSGVTGPIYSGSRDVKFKDWYCSWWIPKHFIGKVIK